MTRRRVLMRLYLLGLACAAAGLPASAQELQTPPADKGYVYFIRPSGFQGGGVALRLTVDGQPVGRLGAKSYHPVLLEPGLHVVGLEPERRKLMLGAKFAPLDVNVEPGQRHFVRATITVPGYGGWSVEFQGLDEPAGAALMAGLKPAKQPKAEAEDKPDG